MEAESSSRRHAAGFSGRQAACRAQATGASFETGSPRVTRGAQPRESAARNGARRTKSCRHCHWLFANPAVKDDGARPVDRLPNGDFIQLLPSHGCAVEERPG